MPPPLRWLVPPLARRGMRASLRGHGMGRHSADEVMAIGCRDITAVADLLGEQAYMLGDTPTSIDASAYAFLANVLWSPVASPIQAHAARRPTLAAYCQRMKSRYYA
jgi:glutathione S-transferase